jgi:hypothetical protein
MADDLLLRLSARAGAFAFLDTPSKIEVFALGSFSTCLLGSLARFPLPANLAIALLGLLACRSRSEAQLAGLCGFCVFTTITDLIEMARGGTSGWGGTMCILNIILKLFMAANAYRIVDALGALDEMAPNDDLGEPGQVGSGSAASGFPTAYHAPTNVSSLPEDDAPVGEGAGVTRYRAI